jgi:cytochrome c oxidase subunit 2
MNLISILLFFQVTGSQSTLNPAGIAAHRISTLEWFILITFMVVTLVMWVLIAALAVRRRGSLEWHAPYDATGGQNWILAGGLLIPVLVLTAIFLFSLTTLKTFPLSGRDPNPDIVVIGHQWWWEVHYVDGPLQDHFITADEIHIPVDHPMWIELRSADVIHSFWIPRLHGKEDLIPGEINRIRIEANVPGTYRGECTVFCGVQHAHMGLLVIAQEPQAYEKWLADQRKPAAQPTTAAAEQGEHIFMSGPCSLCHAIRGTLAGGTVAPNLTHIASRLSLAADTLTNNKGSLAAWITHAQSLKPGAAMPDLTAFNGQQLRDLVDYLEQLH